MDGVLDIEAETFLERISENLAVKWDKTSSVVMGWIRAWITIANFTIINHVMFMRITYKVVMYMTEGLGTIAPRGAVDQMWSDCGCHH